MNAVRSATAGWLVCAAGCVTAHALPIPCDPAGSDCPDGHVCRQTLTADGDGDYQCMRACGTLSDRQACEDGSTCVPRRPGPEWACWPGGPVARGERCDHPIECAFGLWCTRDRICEELCSADTDCTTPGLRCEWSTCVHPTELGAPCRSPFDCSPGIHSCGPQGLFTCQAACTGGRCPDGRVCTLHEHCLEPDPPRVDACSREDPGSCSPREACVAWMPGVHRCMHTGCDPDDAFASCFGRPCLPDPEAPSQFVCWLGGSTSWGEPCLTDYECVGGACRNGACTPDCGDGRPTCQERLGDSAHAYTCNDGYCEREPS